MYSRMASTPGGVGVDAIGELRRLDVNGAKISLRRLRRDKDQLARSALCEIVVTRSKTIWVVTSSRRPRESGIPTRRIPNNLAHRLGACVVASAS